MCAIGGSRNSDTVKTQRINYVRQHLSISTRDPVILSMEVRGTQEIIIDTEGQRGTPCTVEAKTEELKSGRNCWNLDIKGVEQVDM